MVRARHSTGGYEDGEEPVDIIWRDAGMLLHSSLNSAVCKYPTECHMHYYNT